MITNTRKFINTSILILILLIIIMLLCLRIFIDFRGIDFYIDKEFGQLCQKYGENFESYDLNNGISWHIYYDIKKQRHLQVAVNDNGIVKIIYLNEVLRGNSYLWTKALPGETRNTQNEINIKILNSNNNISGQYCLYISSCDIEDTKDLYYSNLSVQKQQMLYLLNFERGIRSFKSLNHNDKLDNVCQNYVDLVSETNFFSHTSQDNKTVIDRIKEVNIEFKSVSENLARGLDITLFEIHYQLMESKGHFANMVDYQMKTVGIGIKKINSEVFICQNFIGY